MTTREIKFRIIYQKEVYGYIVNIGGEWWYSYDNNKWGRDELKYTHKDKTCLLNQYTGLKDKNGKEIYEGDIVNGFLTIGNGENYDFTDVVSYLPPMFWCENNADFSLDQYDELEVIGNIYENPELLINKTK